MAQYQVTAIRKLNRLSTHEHITHIGNPQAGWIITREEAIRQIESRLNEFYVVDPGNSQRIAWVGVRHDVGKLPYLRTYSDGNWNDNLLSLPQC